MFVSIQYSIVIIGIGGGVGIHHTNKYKSTVMNMIFGGLDLLFQVCVHGKSFGGWFGSTAKLGNTAKYILWIKKGETLEKV